MGISIGEIIPKKEIEIRELKGKIIAIDAHNTLYQFLTTIRQLDGAPLMDRNNKITSHLSGLFYRNINLIQEGIKPIYVFDGKPPKLKETELNKRKEQKIIAEKKFEIAKKEGDYENMRKYSSRFVRITPEIVEESKELLNAMGIPFIQAPEEGEAEAAALVKKKIAWASASQDYDSILYGVPRLIRNLTLSRRKKTPSGVYIEIKPELIELEEVISKLQIDKDQLICLGILVGTDYNPGGVKGLGQKKALEVVRKYEYPIEIFKHIEKSTKYHLDFNWREIFNYFHEYKIQDIKEIKFKEPDEKKIKEILLKRDFSLNRINSGLDRLKLYKEKHKQKDLKEFF